MSLQTLEGAGAYLEHVSCRIRTMFRYGNYRVLDALSSECVSLMRLCQHEDSGQTMRTDSLCREIVDVHSGKAAEIYTWKPQQNDRSSVCDILLKFSGVVGLTVVVIIIIFIDMLELLIYILVALKLFLYSILFYI